jgi:hypothetical protein
MATHYELNADGSQFLLGNCHMNASEMAARLKDAGFSPVLVYGSLSQTQVDEPGGSVHTSYFHVWVEVEHAGETLLVEPCTEWADAHGLPYISSERPESYVVPPESKFLYEDWMDYRIVGISDKHDMFVEKTTMVD